MKIFSTRLYAVIVCLTLVAISTVPIIAAIEDEVLPIASESESSLSFTLNFHLSLDVSTIPSIAISSLSTDFSAISIENSAIDGEDTLVPTEPTIAPTVEPTIALSQQHLRTL